MSNLQLYEPFQNFWGFADEVGQLVWGPGRQRGEDKAKRQSFVPAIDVFTDQESLKIRAELPGLKKEDLSIRVLEGVLTISGEKKAEIEEKREDYYRLERSYGSFARSFSLPNTVDAERVQATMKDGILELSIPKKPEAKEREIAIEVH